MINDTSSVDGGSAKLALALTEKLLRSGRKIKLFAGDNADDETLQRAGVSMSGVGGVRLAERRLSSAITGLYNAAAAQKLQAFISQNDTPGTIYHLHSWAQILSPSIFEALKPVADRSVATLHDFFIACPNGSFFVYPKEAVCKVRPLSAKCVLTNCDKRNYAHKLWRVVRQAGLRRILDTENSGFTFVVIDDAMKPYLARTGMDVSRLKTIGNPADRFFSSRVESEKNKNVVFIGRLQREKGVDLLASAAAAAEAPLEIIGDGPLRSMISELYPRAVLSGWRRPEGVADALRRARFLVMPSRCVEPFGLVAAEALCAGVPVLYSDTCMIGDQISNDGSGRRVDIYDNQRFAASIQDMMSDDALIREMSLNAWNKSSLFAQTFDEWTSAYLSLYDELIAKAAS